MNKSGSNLKTVSFKTLGCKLNQSETDAIQDKFKEKGFEVKPFGENVDLTVLNTCTVTNAADSGSRAAIRQAVRNSPNGRIAVTGCYAQVSPQEIKNIPGVDLVLGNDEKYKIFTYLDELKNGKLEEPLVFVNDEGGFANVSEDGFISATSRTRAFLKVQEGCDYYCSYCIIPFSRGRARSRPYEETLLEARKLVDKGFQEIVLTGINIGTYEYEGKETYDIADLLDGLQQIEGLKRLRLSSIEPNTISEDLLELIRYSKVICPHMHIPLQSGNNDQLEAMNRKYRIDEYQDLMNRFVKYIPDAALGTDVIVGFPGETEEHFANTVNFIQNQPYTYLHIFRYSDRKGTAASKSKDKVDPKLVKSRSQILHQLGKKLKQSYYQKYLGQTLPVLFDQVKDGKSVGYTNNYIQVEVESAQDLQNQIHDVTLKGITDKGLCQAILTDKSKLAS